LFLSLWRRNNTEYRSVPFLQPPSLNIMIFSAGWHHWQDVILVTPPATLRPIQGQALPPRAMGDTALACFGQIPTIDRQRAWQRRATTSDNVDNDGNSSNNVVTSSTVLSHIASLSTRYHKMLE
jgi:hypothetical protein